MPRQSQNQSPAPSRKKALLSAAILLALTGVLILLFQDHWAEISAALAQLSLGQVALVLALGITYPLLEGVASWLIVRSRLPGFTLRHGIDNAWMGTFGNIICLGAGAVPMQTYYLHRCGLGLGPGVGLMTLQYVFHKAAVLVYATVLLLWNRQWFTAHATGVLQNASGVGREPLPVPKQQYRGIHQNGSLMEDVLQGHQPHAGAKPQPAAVEVVGLHGHRSGPQTDDVAKRAHPCVVDAVPQGKAGQAAAHDEPAGHTLQKRVGDAQSQHQRYLSERKLGQRGGDLGPVILEQQDEHARQGQQDGCGEQGFFAGGGRALVLALPGHGTRSFLNGI